MTGGCFQLVNNFTIQLDQLSSLSFLCQFSLGPSEPA
jgi:hypothetical protein